MTPEEYIAKRTKDATCDPEKYGHMNPDEFVERLRLTFPPFAEGIPTITGYYWAISSLELNWPSVTMVYVTNGRVWRFSGERIPNPTADKMWFQGGIVPPWPTDDHRRYRDA